MQNFEAELKSKTISIFSYTKPHKIYTAYIITAYKISFVFNIHLSMSIEKAIRLDSVLAYIINIGYEINIG